MINGRAWEGAGAEGDGNSRRAGGGDLERSFLSPSSDSGTVGGVGGTQT